MQVKTHRMKTKSGLLVTFRAVEIEEAEILKRWMASSTIARTIASNQAMSLEKEESWIKKFFESGEDEIMIGIEVDGQLIGTSTASREGLHYRTGSLIGEVKFQGQGFGTAAHDFRDWLAFTRLKQPAYKLKSEVLWTEGSIQNHASRRALEKAGYISLGIRYGEMFRNGVLADLMEFEAYNPMFFGNHPDEKIQVSVKRVREVIEYVEQNIEYV